MALLLAQHAQEVHTAAHLQGTLNVQVELMEILLAALAWPLHALTVQPEQRAQSMEHCRALSARSVIMQIRQDQLAVFRALMEL